MPELEDLPKVELYMLFLLDSSVCFVLFCAREKNVSRVDSTPLFKWKGVWTVRRC